MRESLSGLRVRRPLVALVAALAWAGLVTAWALASPHGATRGAERVLVAIWCVEEAFGRCDPSLLADQHTRLVPEVIVRQSCVRDDRERSSVCLESITRVGGSLVEVPVPRGASLVDLPQTSTGRPDRYLRAQAALVTDDARASMVRIRALNVSIAVLLPLLAFLVAPERLRQAMIVSALALVPLGLTLLGSVDSSAWTIVGALVVWPMAVVSFEQGRVARRIAAGTVGLAGALLLVTPIGAPPFRTGLFLFLTVAAIVVLRRLRRVVGPWDRRSVGVLLLVAVAVSSVARTFLPFPLWRHVVPVRSLIADPTLIPRALGDLVGRGTGLDPEMVRMPLWVSAVLVIALLTLLLAGLGSLDWPGRLVVMLVVAAGVVHLAYVTRLEGFALEDAPFGARHYLPLVILVAAIAATPVDTPRALLPPLWARALAVVVTLAHAVALRQHLARFVAPSGSRRGVLLEVEWWWSVPFGPEMVWIVGAAAMGVLAASAAVVVGGPTRGAQ